MASVIVVNKHASREVRLQNAVTVVGRDGGVSLELGDLQVSRRHALLVQSVQGFFVKDLGSRNGVLLNKRRLGSRTQAPLKNGDVLNLGRTTLIFKDLGAAEDDDDAPTVHTVQTVEAARKRGHALEDKLEGAARGGVSHPGEPPVIAIRDEPAPSPAREVERKPKPEVYPTPRSPQPKRRRPPAQKNSDIPRAMAPGAVAYAGQAELLALRALVDRAERDRVYYRNLALILFVLLVGTLILVFVWALFQGQGDRIAETPIPQTAPAPSAPAEAAQGPALDPVVFAGRVQPILSARCASCHEYVGRGGDLLLAKSSDPQTVEANLAAVSRFVVPGEPEQSALLLEPLAPEESGGDRGCDAVLTMDSPEWRTLRAWVNGAPPPAPRAPSPRPAAASGEPPTARIAGPERGVVGEELSLSGRESSDPEGADVTFRWTLLEAPDGATAVVQDAEQSQARFSPDVPGRYVMALVVRDEAATGSAEHTLLVEPRPDPSREAGLRRASESLLGRAPTGEELAELEGLKGEALVAFFLDRDELYRRWWAAELHYLGLIGPNRPAGEPWDSLPRRLKSGKYTVQNAYYALLVGQNFTARYSGREAYVSAVLSKVLGPEKSRDPALREAGLRLFDGHESTLLGKRTKGQVGLVRVTVAHALAQRHLLWRSYRDLLNREPTDGAIAAAQSVLREHPTAYFRTLVEWACQGL